MPSITKERYEYQAGNILYAARRVKAAGHAALSRNPPFFTANYITYRSIISESPSRRPLFSN